MSNDAMQRALEAIAKEEGISVTEVRRRLAIELEVKAARAKGAPDWAIDMIRACPTADVQDIRAHAHIPGPSAAGASGDITKISNSPGIPGSNTGWRNATPLGPPPGINYVDALCIADDLRQRGKK